MPDVKIRDITETLGERLTRVIDAHFHPQWGSTFWLERARELKLDARRQISSLSDFGRLGETTAADLSSRPLLDFIPRRLQARPDQLVVAQTGGTTGPGIWTAYRCDEFDEAFVIPFVAAAGHVGFPTAEQWLFVGPSGPHIIGKAMRHLAASLGSPDPFCVDFDPRWARKLTEASFARQRYLQHVVDQAMAVLASQDIGVLFTTPVVLEALARRMSDAQRERIRGVHYGGMSLDREQLRIFQTQAFPDAVHLSGYGNTLFGCCLELSVEAGRVPAYFPHGQRLILETVDPEGRTLPEGAPGRVRFTRLDETMLIVRFAERDLASLVLAPADAPEGFSLAGARDPQPEPSTTPRAAIGLY